MLSIESLTVAYGGLKALVDVSIDVAEGQFIAIVGPNGAGKTTLFTAISGIVRPQSDSVKFDGQDLNAIPPAERAHHGSAHVTEGRQVFKSLTVLENLEMGAHSIRGRAEWKRNLAQIVELFPVLAERRDQMAIDDINNGGGIKSMGGAKLRLVTADAGDSTEKAKNAAQRFVASEPDMVGATGVWLSSFTLAVDEVTVRAEMPILTLSYECTITASRCIFA